ncbi:MAG: biopolymer transporter ExbD [Fuerstiella sp.]|nr:biopolymer transporter ExbD [Fuerstiella sp.]MCP4857264.1 biopolymer transporter ExbD [Fuerstiella sp.]
MFDEGGFGKKKKKDEAELDITPMIDVVFLLLIFFMVTSTMQGTPDRDIPPASSGTNANVAGHVELTIKAPASSSSEGEIVLDGQPASLDQIKADLTQRATLGELKIMIYAERDVKSGFVGEVEQVIGEVSAETETEISMQFAVSDRR